jgi:hypothetical protein
MFLVQAFPLAFCIEMLAIYVPLLIIMHNFRTLKLNLYFDVFYLSGQRQETSYYHLIYMPLLRTNSGYGAHLQTGHALHSPSSTDPAISNTVAK